MKKLLTTIVCLILLMGTSMMNARPPMYTSTNTEVPSKLVKNEHGSWQLIVNGKPFIMLAGELHNHRIFEQSVDSLKNTEPEHGARPHRLGTV